MLSGVGKGGRPGGGHLTLVSDKFKCEVKGGLAGLISVEDVPRSFRIFENVTFTTDDQISRPENGYLLLRAVTHYMERIASDPAFLVPFVNNLRLNGIKTVIFRFAMDTEEGEITLKIAGIKEDTPPMKTEVLLFRFGDD